jgi:hypothetical protein
MLIIRSRRRHLKREKAAEAAEAADTTIKRTRSGKKYDGLCDILRVHFNRMERKKRKKQREKLAIANATGAATCAATGAATSAVASAIGASGTVNGAIANCAANGSRVFDTEYQSSTKKARTDNDI